jgi:hypothetical protein
MQGHAAEAFGSLVVLVTTTMPTPQAMRLLSSHGAPALERHPEGIRILIVNEPLPLKWPGRDPVGDSFRSAVTDLMTRYGTQVRGLAYLYPQGGVVASVIRVSLQGLTMLGPFPARLFREMPPALGWLGERAGAARDDRDALLEGIARLRAEVRGA